MMCLAIAVIDLYWIEGQKVIPGSARLAGAEQWDAAAFTTQHNC